MSRLDPKILLIRSSCKNFFRPCLLAVGLLFCFNPAYGKTHVGESLEWMTVDSPLIVRGVVSGVEQSTDPASERPLWVIEDVTVKILEVLKGDYERPSVTFRRLSSGYATAKDWKRSQDEFLFFLNMGQGRLYGFNRDGFWAMRGDYPDHPINLTQPRQKVVLSNMTVASDAKDILSTVQNRLSRVKSAAYKLPQVHSPEVQISYFKVPQGALILEVPENAAAFNVLWSGSACFLRVPADPEYEETAMKLVHSNDYEDRVKGAQMLGSFPGEDTTAILKLLLRDPQTHEVTYGAMNTGQTVVPTYGVREAAYQSLQRLAIQVEKPTLQDWDHGRKIPPTLTKKPS